MINQRRNKDCGILGLHQIVTNLLRRSGGLRACAMQVLGGVEHVRG